MVTVGLVRAIGPLRANHVRLWFVSAMLLSAAVFFGEWAVALLYIWPIAISGVVGIAVGDCLLFSALKRLGPSRNFVTFSSAAPFGALLGFFVLRRNFIIQCVGRLLVGCCSNHVGIKIITSIAGKFIAKTGHG